MLIGFDLLDRQIIDRDGAPVGKVDDVEHTYDDTRTPHVTALLLGRAVLGDRIGGRLGRWIAGTARRLSDSPDRPPMRISIDLVAAIDSAVNRALRQDPPPETWLRDHLIQRTPGATHES